MIDLWTYIAISFAYLLFMHLALSTTNEFHSALNVVLFVLGGAIGFYLGEYMVGFVFAVVMHFVFWSKGSD